MTTEKQLIANRQNAQFSTGPQTTEGKAIVSKNAIKHGLFAQEVIICDEERALFVDFVKALYEHFAPKNSLEALLVEKIIVSAWRLRKVIGIESLIFSRENMETIFSHSIMVQQQSNQNMTTLSRYEQAIEKSLFRNLQALEKLRGQIE